MKIEASKNHPVERKESKNVFKTEHSMFNSSTPPKPTAAGTASPPSAFAKILEETRRENEKDNSPAAKTDSAENDLTTSKSEKDEKINRPADEKKELEERNAREGDSDGQPNGDENQSHFAALAALQTPSGTVSESAAPAARAVLHVADLERIIATIRTENFQNQKQIIIALKNSVLQGLQIKLTLNENGKLKAEFLASGQQIKKQLSQRKNELAEILKNRSALFAEIDIKTPDSAANE
jgi:hypothetical protein